VSPAIGGQSIRLPTMSSTATRTALEPLRALRYDQSKVGLADVVAPPYDVVTPAQRDALIRRSEYSVVRLELPESAQAAADLLHEWQRDGVMRRDDGPALWWHSQTFTGPDGVDRVRRGFFAAVRLSPYDEGRIRPHEHTHASVRAERLELMRATRANLSPILGVYDDPDSTAAASLGGAAAGEPTMSATDSDGTVHRFWEVTDAAAIDAVRAAMAEREILIADGHHRYETALAYQEERRAAEGDPAGDRPYDFILMCLCNLRDEGLAIYPTHRVVLSHREVDRRFLHAFSVREIPAGTPAAVVEAELNEVPVDTVAFAVWRGADETSLLAELTDPTHAMLGMPGVPAAIRSLDAAVLEALVLSPLLGLDGEQFLTTDGVRYLRGLDQATALVDSGEAGAAFLLRAPTVEQVQDVTAAGHVMPQKSTYFFPKLWSGFLLNPLSDD
jgi:uncharacterized protein (DUF1015 family)